MSRVSAHEKLRSEAIRLRKDSRLGTKEISRRTGVPMSTLHGWLKDHPLTRKESRAIRSAAPRYRAPKKTLPGAGETPWIDRSALGPQSIGFMGESAVLFALARNGFAAARPVADCDVVDIYARRPGGERVAFLQVRVTSSPPARTGLPTVSLRRVRNGKAERMRPGDFHFLVGFCPDNGRCYVFSADEVAHLANSVTIRDDAEEAWHKLERFLDQDALVAA